MFYVGIDGGGTNTRVCIINEKKEILGIGKSGPSSIDTVNIETTIHSFQQAMDEVFDNLNIKDRSIGSIFVGIGGVLTDSSKEHVKKFVKEISYIDNNTLIKVENDVYNALLGGNETRPGICLIAGTGSVAFGVDESGKTHRAGGYGYQEGDLGSSFDLGKRTLQHVARVFDKRVPITPFSEAVLNHLNINDVGDLLNIIMTYHEDRTKTASLAPLVTKYADLNDVYAISICDRATDELALCVKSVHENIKLDNKELAIIGSLGNSKGYFHNLLIQKIMKIANFKIHGPLIEPVIGSAYKAFNMVKK